MIELDGVRHGSTWKRNPPGREVVRIERVWKHDDETLVRAHPIHGGRPLVASTDYLREHYTERLYRSGIPKERDRG